MGKGRSREQWTAVVNAMVARGAKASDAELVQIAEYLTSHLGPTTAPAAAPPARGGRPAMANRGPGPLGAGRADSQVVDDVAAERGRKDFNDECITCHGLNGRGGNDTLPKEQQGPDLVRSLVVLHDRYGNELGPFLKKGHPMRGGRTGASLTEAQITDLSHYLHRTVYYTLRSGPMLKVQNILSGDKAAGAAYFNGAGKCNTCHSPAGDLAGIGTKYDPPTLQTKFLFPKSVGFARGGRRTATTKPVMVTVTPAGGAAVEGTLIHVDDFNVSLREKDGQYRSFAITPGMKVVRKDPYATHIEMLDHYTDKNIHDIVAYLESLK